MKTILSLALFALALTGATPEQDVANAEKAWSVAVMGNDYAALEKVLGDELIYTHSNGESDSKRLFIDNLKNNVRKYHAVEYDKQTVKVIGNTAMVSVMGKLKVTTRGTLGEVKVSFLHVYVKRGGAWQLVGHQSARL